MHNIKLIVLVILSVQEYIKNIRIFMKQCLLFELYKTDSTLYKFFWDVFHSILCLRCIYVVDVWL